MATSDDTHKLIATEEPSSQLVTTLPNESAELTSVLPTLTFINHAGKKFVFPFRECSSWEGMGVLIKQAYSHTQDPAQLKIFQNRFELLDSNKETIIPAVWSSVVQPGCTIFLSLLSPGGARKIDMSKERSVRISDSVDEFGSEPEPEPTYDSQESDNSEAESDFDSDSDSELSTDSTDSDSSDNGIPIENAPPPILKMKTTPPVGMDGKHISFNVDTRQFSYMEEKSSTKRSFAGNLMAREFFPIKMCQFATSEDRTFVQLHTLGPGNLENDDEIVLRWHHLSAKVLDFEQFKTECLAASGDSNSLRILSSRLLEKVEKEKLRKFHCGYFIEPGTAMRCEEGEKDANAVIFVSVPYLDVCDPLEAEGKEYQNLHPTRGLLQSYYPYQPIGDREREQTFHKYRNDGSKKIVHVPQIWLAIIGGRAIVTCGVKPFAETVDKSINIVKELAKSIISSKKSSLNSISSLDASKSTAMIRIRDWDEREVLHSPEECPTYLALEQKLRELQLTSLWPSAATSLKMAVSENGVKKEITPEGWADILRSRNTGFIDISILKRRKENGNEDATTHPPPQPKNDILPSKIAPFVEWPLVAPKEKDSEPLVNIRELALSLWETDEHTQSIVDTAERIRSEYEQGDPVNAENSTEPRSKYKMEVFINLARIEDALMRRTLNLKSNAHTVERAFKSTKYYESIKEKTHSELMKAYETFLLNKNDDFTAGESSSNTKIADATSGRMHQRIVDWQHSQLDHYSHTLIQTTEHILRLNVPDIDMSPALRKVWGAIDRVLNILLEAKNRDMNDSKTAQALDQLGQARLGRKVSESWVIRPPSSLRTQCKPLSRPDGTQLRLHPDKCRVCPNKIYRSRDLAIKHLREVHFPYSENLPTTWNSAIEEDLINDWVCNGEELVLEHWNDALVTILAKAADGCTKFHSELTEIVQGVSTESGLILNRYVYPHGLNEALRSIIIFILAIERSISCMNNMPQRLADEEVEDGETDFDDVFKIIKRFRENTRDGIRCARRSLCDMTATPPEEDLRFRLSLGPEFLASWLIRRLLVKTVEKGKTVSEYYREHLLALQFHVNHKPGKNLLRDINFMQEELTALARVTEWQNKLLFNYSLLLDDVTYQVRTTRRRALFIYEQDILHNCQSSILYDHEDYIELLSRCRTLSETAKQGIEIYKEDHGKAILVFTLVTAIFLPLSFVTSYLGMNTADIRDMANTQTLFWKIAVPLTSITLGSILLIAYNGDRVRAIISSLARAVTGKPAPQMSGGLSVARRKPTVVGVNYFSNSDDKSLANEADCVLPLHVPNQIPTLQRNLTQIRLMGEEERLYTSAEQSARRRSQSLRNINSGWGATSKTASVDRHMHPNGLPTYPRIHKKHLDIETLEYYNIPWDYDERNPDYFVLCCELSMEETDILFWHTQTGREQRSGSNKPRGYNWSRENSHSHRRSGPSRHHSDSK